MHVLALVEAPRDPNEAAQAFAKMTGQTLAEARMRLAPEPPMWLGRFAPEVAVVHLQTLRAQRLKVVSVDEEETSFAAWFVPRKFTLDGPVATFTSGGGETRMIPWDSLTVVLRAASRMRSELQTPQTVRTFSLGKSLATGGLSNTKKVTSTVRTTELELESSLYLFDADGQGVVLKERSLDFTSLGKHLGPARTQNMTTLARLVKERATRAFYDERLVRLGTRTLPAVGGGEFRYTSKDVNVSRTSTAGSVDLLAEFLRLGVAEGLIGVR